MNKKGSLKAAMLDSGEEELKSYVLFSVGVGV